MSKRTSITERLKKSQKRTTRQEFAHEWADEWEADYLDVLGRIKIAVADGDIDAVKILFAKLGHLQRPKFEALHNVIDELIYPTRHIADD